MAGLLDMFNNISPEQNQGLLAAAAQILQNSGPSRQPFSLGQAMGTGIGAYQQTMEANRVRRLDEQRQAQQDAFQQEYRTVQIDGLKAQKAEREAKLTFDAARQDAIRKSIVNGQLDMKALAANLAPFDPEGAAEIMKQSAPKPVTYATNPVEVMDAKGRPMLIQPASDGTHRVMEGFRPYVAPSRSAGGGSTGGAASVAGMGRIPAGYRLSADGQSLEAIPGGPASMNISTPQQKIADAKDVISLIDQAKPIVSKATGSYGGVAVDAAARLIGKSTPGADAAAQLSALEGVLISKMPKMSGPQSDKDVAMYRQMAGKIGDPTIPESQKLAAMETIKEIALRNAGGYQQQAPAPTGGKVRKYNPATGRIE